MTSPDAQIREVLASAGIYVSESFLNMNAMKSEIEGSRKALPNHRVVTSPDQVSDTNQLVTELADAVSLYQTASTGKTSPQGLSTVSQSR